MLQSAQAACWDDQRSWSPTPPAVELIAITTGVNFVVDGDMDAGASGEGEISVLAGNCTWIYWHVMVQRR